MTSDSSTAFTPLLSRRAGLLLVSLLASGCAAERLEVDAERTIAESLALPDAVTFRTEGGQLDASPRSTGALSLADAVRRAVETSPELQAALARVRVAEAEADLARLLPNPVLDFVLRIPEGGGQAQIEGALGADLLAILQRPRRSSAAGHRLEAEAAHALSTALDVVAETQDFYSAAQVLEELVSLLEARVALLDRLREVAEARLELGEGTRHDVTTLAAERADLAVEASGRRRDLRLARLALARRIGEPSGEARWTLDPWQAPPAVPTAESAWIGVALERRPEVLAIQWELRARADEAAIAGWSALDGLAVGVDGEREDGESSLGPGVSVPLPLFDQGSARTRRASALETEARHRLVEAQRAVVEEVRSSLAALSASQENLARVSRELVPLQEQRRAEIEEAYRIGHVDVTALLAAEQALRQSQILRVGLEREVSTALLRLERSIGGRSVLDSGVGKNPSPEPDRRTP